MSTTDDLKWLISRDGSERCAWCSHWRAAGEACRECDCAPIAAEHYGVAVMLRGAGVDRIALPKRVNELEAAEAERLQARFAEQLDTLANRIDEIRFCESFLLQRRFLGQIADDLFASLPWSRAAQEQLGGPPHGPFEDPAVLDGIVEDSPVVATATLAAIALAHRCEAEAEVLRRVEGTVQTWRDPGDVPSIYEVEAALALGHWRYHFGPVDRRLQLERRQLAAVARVALDDEELRTRAAVICALPHDFALQRPWMTRAHQDAIEEMNRLEPVLQDGLTDPNEDVRFACALTLGDVGTLRLFRRHGDARVRQTAEDMLARVGSTEVVDTIRDGDMRMALDVIQRLPVPPAPELLTAVLVRAGEALPQEQKQIGRHLRRASLDDYDGDGRQALAGNVDRTDGPLPVEELFDWVRWATKGESDNDAPRLDADSQPFVDAAARSLQPREASHWVAAVRASGIRAFLWSGRSEPVQRMLDAWAVHEGDKLGAELFNQVSSLDSLAERFKAEDAFPAAREIALGIWERAAAEDRLRIAAHLGQGWSWSYAQDRDAAFELFWARYRDHGDERAAIRVALQGLLRSEGGDRLKERHRAELPDVPLCGDDPAGFFHQLALAQPGSNYDHLKLTLEDTPMAEAPDVLAAAAARRPLEDRVTGQLPPFVLFARWLVEQARLGVDPDELYAAALALEKVWASVVQGVTQPGDSTDSYYFKEKKEEVAGCIEKVRTLIAEGAGKAPEKPAPPVDPPDDRPVDPPKPPPDFEIVGDSDPTAGPPTAFDAIVGKLLNPTPLGTVRPDPPEPPAAPAPPRPPTPAPRTTAPPTPSPPTPPSTAPLGSDPLDDEIVVAGHPVQTLRQYVELVRALQAATQTPLDVLADFGLDLETFSPCLQAWGTTLAGRTDLAVRFGALMSQPG